jgi:ADP-heptose:LPS heptosyltransferase
MMVASFPVTVQDSGWQLIPRTRFVMSGGFFYRVLKSMEAAGVPDPYNRPTCFNNYERRYGGHDLNGKTIAIFRESGLGDHLIVTALCGYLRWRFPKATIEVYGSDRSYDAWCNNTEARFIPMLPSFEGLTRSDCHYHLLMEGMMESDLEFDQPNTYDSLYTVAGFNPKTIGPEWKRPRLFMGPDDEKGFEAWDKERRKESIGKYVLVHWNPSGAVRMYPPELYHQVILKLAEYLDVVVVGQSHPDMPPPHYVKHERIHYYYDKCARWRHLLPQIAMASAIVCPDSSVGHAAACWPDVPVISLWGAFGPADRVLYYKNHFPIVGEGCPHSCKQQYSLLPTYLCKDSPFHSPDSPWCGKMASIQPETVIKAVLAKL